jgi:hypothetical protein
MQETSEVALIAAQAYLLTTRPEPRDPREDMHQAAIRSLKIVEDKIRGKGLETKSTNYKERRKEKFKHNITRNESSAVTQHTTACCSMQVVDITLAERASTNITSLRMVQQKHCGPKYKLIHIILQNKA